MKNPSSSEIASKRVSDPEHISSPRLGQVDSIRQNYRCFELDRGGACDGKPNKDQQYIQEKNVPFDCSVNDPASFMR